MFALSESKPLLVTVDTCAWIDLLKNQGSALYVVRIVYWHDQGMIRVFASNRTFDPDSWRMPSEHRAEFASFLSKHHISVTGAGFRSNYSKFGGPDALSPAPGVRSPEEIQLFREIAGPAPGSLPKGQVGKRLSNKIGDYDALSTHFLKGRDVFVTLDKKEYFSPARRHRFHEKLGLLIQEPADFVAAYEKCLETVGRSQFAAIQNENT